jgi:hypothetical protein
MRFSVEMYWFKQGQQHYRVLAIHRTIEEAKAELYRQGDSLAPGFSLRIRPDVGAILCPTGEFSRRALS